MADAFRGLTIRIGADSRPVQSAISSITRSASQAQTQLNRMQKALRFDKGNIGAMRSAIALVGDKATHSARAATTLRTAMNQASKEALKFSERSGLAGGSMKKVANSTTDVYAATQKIRAEYNHVDAELQHVYDAVKQVVRETKGMTFDEADKHVKKLQRSMSGVGREAKSARNEMYALVRAAAVRTDLSKTFGLEQNFGAASKMLGIYRKLRGEQAALKGDLATMNKVEGFRAMRAQLIGFKADLREAAAEAARLKSQLYSTGSTKGLSEALSYTRRLDAALEASVADARTLSDAFKSAPRSVEAARAKIVSARSAIEAYKEKIQSLRSVMQSIEKSGAFDRLAASTGNVHVALEKAEHDVAEIGAELKSAEAKAESFNAELKEAKNASFVRPHRSLEEIEADLKKANSELAKVKSRAIAADKALESAALNKRWRESATDVQRLRAELEKLRASSSRLSAAFAVGRSMREAGFGFYASVTPAISIAGRYAIRAAEDIDSAYRDMRKTVNGTEEQFEHLRQAALEYSTTHVTTAEQMLEIESIGGQLGIVAGNLEAFGKTVSDLDIATNMDTQDIALNLAKMSNIMHFGQDQYDSFADALVRLGNNEPALESDIMAISTRFAGMAANVGMATSDMLGLATAATATGQKAEAAGGSIQRTIARIEAAVASGGEELEAYAQVSSMTAEEFASTWGDSANHGPIRAIQAFIGGLKDIRDNGGSVIQALNELGITGVRDRQLLSGLTNTTDVLADSVGMAGDAWDGMSTTMKDGAIEQAGDAAREAQRKSEGFSGEIQMMRNNAMMLANELADGAVPVIMQLGDMLQDLTEAVSKMPQDAKTNVVKFAVALAAAGPALVGFGTALIMVQRSFGAFGGFTRWLMEAGVRLQGFDMQMSATAGKVTKGATAVHGLGKALSAIGTTGGMVAITGVAIAVGAIATSIGEHIGKLETFGKATDGLKAAAERAGAVIEKASGPLDVYGQRAASNAKSVDEMTEAQARLADEMDERARAAEAEIGQLQAAKQAIDKYTNKDLSDNIAAQGELIAAVDVVNEKLGTHYQVLDAAKGALADESGQLLQTVEDINAYILAKERQIRTDQLSADAASQKTGLDEATATYIDAAKKYDDAMAEFNNMPQGMSPEYIEDARSKVEGLRADMENAKALMESANDSYQYTIMQLGAMAASATEAGNTIENLALQNSTLAMAFSGNADLLKAFATQLDGCGITVDEFSRMTVDKWAEIVRNWDGGASSLSEILSSLGISVRTASGQFAAEMESVQGSASAFHDLAASIQAGDDELAAALQGAGVSAQQFASVTSDAFSALANAAGGELDKMMTALQLINAANLDPKEIKVNADGVTEVEGQVLDIENLKIGDKQFEVTANGLEEVVAEVQAVADEDLTATIEVDAETGDAEAAVGDLADDIEDIPDGGFDVDDSSAEDADGTVEDLTSDINDLPDKTVNVNLSGNAQSALQDIIDKLVWIGENSMRSVTITETTVKQGQAAGGVNMAQLRVPAFASGAYLNGIVKSATLTSQGLVGEAGAEAVIGMGRRTAVVPLSNRRYVRPFARAVASEMGGGQPQVVNQYYVNGVEFREGSDGAEAVKSLVQAAGVAKRRRGM